LIPIADHHPGKSPPVSDAVCLLLSGGIDSAVLLHRLKAQGRNVHALYVRCGYRWEDAEEAAVRRFCDRAGAPLSVLRTNLVEMHPHHWTNDASVPGADAPDSAVALPGRNAFLLSAALIVCDAQRLSEVLLGTLAGNPFSDATARFFRTAEEMLSQSLGRPVTVATPLAGKTKSQVLAEADGLPLELTFSCLDPQAGDVHCGRCNKCAERRRAFAALGLTDPTRYAHA
jgi:7-cyano-7-deazaguanine synthase